MIESFIYLFRFRNSDRSLSAVRECKLFRRILRISKKFRGCVEKMSNIKFKSTESRSIGLSLLVHV